MSEWKTGNLGSISLYVSRGISPKYTDVNGVLVINQKCIRNGKINKNVARLHCYSKKINEAKFLKNHDILINSTGVGTAGRVAIFREDYVAVVDSHVSILRVDQTNVDPNFIFYNLRGREKEIEETAEGSTGQIELSRNGIKNIEILVPDLPEQKAIAEVLSSLDDKIDLLHLQNKTLEALAETLFRQWFVEEASEDWETVKVGDVSEINQSSVKNSYPYEKILYLDTSSITCGIIDSYQKLDLLEAPSRAKRLVKHNDIIISTVRPNQMHYGIIKEPPNNLVVSTGFAVVSATKVAPHFLYLLLTQEDMTEHLQMVAEASTSAYPSLRPSDIAAVGFLCPSAEKMKKFAKIASSHWDRINQNYEAIRTLEQLRDALLPKLMTGEVRVSDYHAQNMRVI